MFTGKAGMTEFPSQIEAGVVRRLVALGVRPGDVMEKFIRGTGAGGQKINKTSSTVWLRHAPTGVEVRIQDERSQTQNRLLAWATLAGKLEGRVRVAADQAKSARELSRRQTRQKSYGQKVRMIESKKHRAGIKARRGRPETD
jgi:protein subunit release factor B